LQRLTAAHQTGRLEFFADQAALAEPAAFKAHLAALRRYEWVVYAKRPFGGPRAVLAYLSRYTHRIVIANSRLVAFDGEPIARRPVGRHRWSKVLSSTLAAATTIITAHMTKITGRSQPVHSGGMAIIWPPPMSIISIPTPAPRRRVETGSRSSTTVRSSRSAPKSRPAAMM
jgi:hypothetical protein